MKHVRLAPKRRKVLNKQHAVSVRAVCALVVFDLLFLSSECHTFKSEIHVPPTALNTQISQQIRKHENKKCTVQINCAIRTTGIHGTTLVWYIVMIQRLLIFFHDIEDLNYFLHFFTMQWFFYVSPCYTRSWYCIMLYNRGLSDTK